MADTVARGPGPHGVRVGLAVVAALYYVALIRHPPQLRGLRAIGFFTESTCLFPRANAYAIEYRLDAWSCTTRKWEPLDPRAYFPIEADDKESRFQRLGYFYQNNRAAMEALDAWISARHDHTADGVAGPIGGIKLAKWIKPLPGVGEPVAPYRYEPLVPVPADQRKDLFWTKASERRTRCGS